ncbi:MAG: hypothetical protein HN417_10875 [Desulfobacula sp.]|jgi:hypothetical protein|nr:hypothetical protein [Desulfobacula sp.]
MDINEGIKILKDELPEVFEGIDFPELEDEWIFFPEDDDIDNHPIFQPDEELDTIGPPEN